MNRNDLLVVTDEEFQRVLYWVSWPHGSLTTVWVCPRWLWDIWLERKAKTSQPPANQGP
jgi:hypothetical protein